MTLINWTNMNIWEYFGNKFENMRFKSCPIFKVFTEPFEIINIPSRHNDEYRMIVDILNKHFISFDKFEITVK